MNKISKRTLKPRLSNSASELQACYDVVVVGSGYGGAIASEKFSRQGLSVCVLERGEEWQPGRFPRSLIEIAQHTRLENEKFRFGKSTSLFNWNQSKGLLVLRGIGLGGGSLINAAVVVRPDENFLDDEAWPTGLRKFKTQFQKSFDRIETSLQVSKLPSQSKIPRKTEVFKQACEDLGTKFELAPLAIQFHQDTKRPDRNTCTSCGECMAGCNEGAKGSLDQNYLKQAKDNGAQFFTETSVSHLNQNADGTWNVFIFRTGAKSKGPLRKVLAQHVVLAAGALGSAEILLRSKRKGLSTSSQLGHSFSGNNCTFGSISYTDKSPKIAGRSKPTESEKPGPCITAYSHVKDQNHPFILEDGTVPSFITQLMAMGPFLMTLERPSILKSWNTKDHWKRLASDFKAVISKGQSGTINDSMIFLMAGQDSSSGVLEINSKGRVHAKWETGRSEKGLSHQMDTIRKLAKKWKGIYSNQALWKEDGFKNKISVHPMGGCRMADSAEDGVVNWKGQVFTGKNDQVYSNLYVWDESIIPKSLGINPLLTISGLSDVLSDVALESMKKTDSKSQKLIQEPTWQYKTPRLDANLTSGNQFQETMAGNIRHKTSRLLIPIKLDLNLLRDQSLEKDPNLGFRFQITGFVDTFIDGQNLINGVKGTAQILSHDTQSDSLKMIYRLHWKDYQGTEFQLQGIKTVSKNISELWSSTTRMPAQLLTCENWDSAEDSWNELGSGELRIDAQNVARMIRSLFLEKPSLHKTLSNLNFSYKFGERLWKNLQ